MSDSLTPGRSNILVSGNDRVSINETHAVSPLEPLDPHRLRDMVVDRQANGSHSLQGNWSSPSQQTTQVNSSPANNRTPGSNVQSPMSVQPQRSSTGFSDHPAASTPVMGMNPQIQQQQQNSPFAVPMGYNPQQQQQEMAYAASPASQRMATPHSVGMIGQSPLGSPPQQPMSHPTPQSPFGMPPRAPSAASSATASPFSMAQPQQVMHTLNAQQYPSSTFPASPLYGQQQMMAAQQQQRMVYPGIQPVQMHHYPYQQPQWVHQQQNQTQQHYMVGQQQQRLMGPPPGQMKPGMPMPVRVPYPGQGYPYQGQMMYPQSGTVGPPPPSAVLPTQPLGPSAGPASTTQSTPNTTPTSKQKGSKAQQTAAAAALAQQQQQQQAQFQRQQQVQMVQGFTPGTVVQMGGHPMQQGQYAASMYAGGGSVGPQGMVGFSPGYVGGYPPGQALQQQLQYSQPRLVPSANPNLSDQQQASGQTVAMHVRPSPPSHLTGYPTAGAAAGGQPSANALQQQPSTPIIQSPVNCGRFPAGIHQPSLSSPRYLASPASGDMRPPPHTQPLIMSPTVGAVQLNSNQLQQIPTRQQVFPSPLSSAGLTLQQQQLMRMPFIGHEPQGAQGARSYSPEICLAGCVFLILDDNSPNLVDRSAMCAAIRFHGGEVEVHSPRTIPDKVTHVICSSVAPHEYLIHQALRDGRRRIVTLHWLNETLMKKRIEAPTKASHLPTCWNENNRPAIGKIITTAGFDELETSNLKAMILAIGGRYTPTLSAHNHLLISKCFSGQPPAANNTRLDKAKQMGVPVVNYQWLVEIYFGSTRPMTEMTNPNYSPINSMSQFETHSTYTLERISDFCQKLLCSWRLAIPLNDNIINMAIELKRSVENDKSVFPHRQFKCLLEEAPSEEQIKEAIEILKKSNKLPKEIRVAFEGLLPLQMECLSKKLRFLGGQVSDSVSDCTHLVVPSLERSVKLMEAIGGSKNVVSVDWILQSYSLLKLVDCVDFFVHDPENERKYGYNLKDTLLRTKSRKVFEDVTFHLSPTVRPSFELLSQMIVAAGGKVERKKPIRKRLARCIEVGFLL